MLQLGYNTNGLAGISVTEAIRLLADIGYAGIAISLDREFLNPFAIDLEHQLAQTQRALALSGLRCVVETGARHLLNAKVKHEPTLVSPTAEGRARRIDFLCRAIDVAQVLRAECVSLWSGVLRDDVSGEVAMDRLTAGLGEILRYAARENVVVAFEPEPDMFIDTMSRYAALVDELAARGSDLSPLRLTMDIGHLHCLGEVPISEVIHRWGDQLANVHIEDMRAGVHEHLMFGEGEIDFPPVIAALEQIEYSGLVNVELSRHSKMGPAAARKAYDFLKPLLAGGASRRRH